MKKFFSILLVLVVGILTGWNMIYSKPDPFALTTGMLVWVLVCIVWVIILFKDHFQTATIYITIIIIFGSAASAVSEVFEVATPLATVNIDNSTNLYPMPEKPNPNQQETLDWIDGKWVIHTGEGAQKIFLASWISSVVSFFLFLFIAWLLSKEFMPKAIRGGSIPIQFILAAIFVVVGINIIASPLNTDGMSQKAIGYIDIQWFAGFLQNRWWPMLLTGIMTVTKWLKGQAGRWQITATVMAAATWLLLPLLQTTFNPTMISWTACSQMVYDSELSNALCQEAFASGTTAMLVLSMAWGLIVSIISDFLGLSDDDSDED